MPQISKNYFLKSFIPSSIRLWNSLPENVRLSDNLDAYKLKISRIYKSDTHYPPHLCGKTRDHIYLCRIRLGLSGLNAHRKKYNFINFSNCPNCQAEHEDEKHFFLFCTQYAAPRQMMIAQLLPLVPEINHNVTNLHASKSQKEMLNTIINGSGDQNTDIQIFNIVSNFIKLSEHFTYVWAQLLFNCHNWWTLCMYVSTWYQCIWKWPLYLLDKNLY